MTFFKTQPEFIDLDPRKDRTTHSYAVSPEFLQKRYEAILPASLIAGRHVVDVGCALGAAGAWALSNGASGYSGIDIAPDYVTAANSLFEKYYPMGNWSIERCSLEEASDFTGADIILCAGAIYAHPNTAAVVSQFSSAKTVIIESMHPSTLVSFGQMLLTDPLYQKRVSARHELLKSVEQEYAYIQLNSDMNMVLGRSGGEIAGYLAAVPSIGALNELFTAYGFSMDLSAYETLKKTLPNTYNFFTPGATTSRFCATFHKQSYQAPKPTSFSEAMANRDNVAYRSFKHK